MKFITNKDVELKNKARGVALTLRPATNTVRFTIYDIGTDESLAGKVKLAEYIYTNCITAISVKGEKIAPEDMVNADLSDSDTADIYFEIVNMVALELLGATEEETEVKK